MAQRSLIRLSDLSDSEVAHLLSRGAKFRERIAAGGFKSSVLRGTSTLLLFYEASTRTRVSFELAGKLLGSDTINVSSKGSSAEKGETLRDTAMTLAALNFSAVVLRHSSVDSAELFSRHFPGPVLNAGAGRGEHPTQALLDALALQGRGLLEPGRHIGIVGDLTNSRVARSNVELLLRFGLRVTLCGPPSLTPPAWREGRFGISDDFAGRLNWTPALDPLLPGLDGLMLLRVQQERAAGTGLTTLDEYSRMYGLHERRLALLNPAAAILHPGPVNRGVEIGESAFADPRCLINYQVECGLALRCALLCWALGREDEPEGN